VFIFYVLKRSATPRVLDPERRLDYVRTVPNLLKTGGYLFLNCFSRLQLGEEGPYPSTPEQIREIFGARLSVLSIKETVYQGTPDPLPRALFFTMRKQKTESKEALQRMTELTEDAGLYDE
jgi:hypothetical protein